MRRLTQRGERANRGPTTSCGRIRVARIAECRLEQKVGYGRHTDQPIPNTTQNGVFGVLWHLKKQGYSEYTINFVRKALKVLGNGCGLDDPERLNDFIAEMDARASQLLHIPIALINPKRAHKTYSFLVEFLLKPMSISNRTFVILLVVIIIGGVLAFVYTVPIITEYYPDIEQRKIGLDVGFLLEVNNYTFFNFTFEVDTEVTLSVSASNTVNLYIMTPNEYFVFERAQLSLHGVTPNRKMEDVRSGIFEYEVKKDDTFFFVLSNPHSGLGGLVEGEDVWINSFSVTYKKGVFAKHRITIIESLKK